MAYRILILALTLALPGCIRENEPQTQVYFPILLASYHREDGNCIIKIPHATIAGAYLYFCGTLPVYLCRANAIALTGEQRTTLLAGLDTIASGYPLCTAEAGTNRTLVNDLGFPNHPIFAKFGASSSSWENGARFVPVKSCAAMDFGGAPYTTGSFQGLLDAKRMFDYNAPFLFQYRYSGTPCQNSLNIAATAANQADDILSGKRPDFLVCDSGEDATRTDCPAAVLSL